MLRLLVGLGNPGREYADTRHNVGFMVLDRMAAAAGIAFRTEKNWKCEIARDSDLLLCKPLTFMNLSGQAVQPVSQFFKIDPGEMIVIFDEMALPIGKLRLRPTGSAGGHNGMRSIIQSLGTSDLPRLRIGIGSAEPGAAIGHVLGRFAPEEKAPLDEAISRSADAIRCVQSCGLEAAMNRFN